MHRRLQTALRSLAIEGHSIMKAAAERSARFIAYFSTFERQSTIRCCDRLGGIFRDDRCDLLRAFDSDFHPGRSFVDPVVTVGSATTGSVPMADVALGAAVGLLFGRVLPTLEQRQGAKAD
jgi:hypothetical protein